MRLDRRDHLVTPVELTSRRVMGSGEAGERVRRVCAAARLEDEALHPREPAEDLVEPVDERENALERLVVLMGVKLRELRPCRERLAEPGVVLHRARPEQADPHHPERLLREVEVVAQDVRLRKLRQVGPRRAPHRRRDERCRIAHPIAHLGLGLGKDEPASPLAGELHHERLVPDGSVVPAQAVHASTSSSAAASRSMSARVCTSVTQ